MENERWGRDKHKKERQAWQTKEGAGTSSSMRGILTEQSRAATPGWPTGSGRRRQRRDATGRQARVPEGGALRGTQASSAEQGLGSTGRARGWGSGQPQRAAGK